MDGVPAPCEDVNECLRFDGACSQHCNNTEVCRANVLFDTFLYTQTLVVLKKLASDNSIG